MPKEQPTRKIVNLLRDKGFKPIRTKGSHTVYEKGVVTVTVPDGHRMISPGVVRVIEKAIREAQE